MADTIGEATVKITADLTPLQQAVNKVDQVVAPLKGKELEGFKIRYDEKEFDSFQAYTEEINRQQQEWESYVETQNQVAEATNTATTSTESLTKAVEQTSAEAQKTTGPINTLTDAVSKYAQMAEGSFLRAKSAIQDAGRVGRTALIGLSAAFVAFGKSSLKEYAKYSQEAADTQEKLSDSVSKLKASFGQMLQPFMNVVAGMFDWASKNPQIVGGVLSLVGVLAGSAGLIALVTKLSKAIVALKTTAGGIIGIVSAAVGVVASLVIQNTAFDETLAETAEREKELDKWNEKLSDSYTKMNDSIRDAGKSMADAVDSFQQSLKQILVNHEETVQTLNDQIAEANKEYIQSVNERNAAFLVSQAEEEEAHQKKVDELMTQLNFLQRYNNAYNREKLEATKFALAREEALYKKRTEAEKAELDLQNAYDKQKRDEKLANYQKELADERAFLEKHAEVFKQVRDVILRDEVENLLKSFEATKQTYNNQVTVARNSYNQMVADAKRATDNINGYLYAEFNGVMKRVETTYKGTIDRAYTYAQGKTPTGQNYTGKVISANAMAQILMALEGYDNGGFTGRGGVDEVAGVVHRGEYVLPQDLVDQTTGTPKIGGNITINLSGTFATSEAEKRKVANQIVEALKQTNYARLGV